MWDLSAIKKGCSQLFCVRRGGSMGLWRDLGTDDRFRRNVLHGFDGLRLVLGTDSRFRRNVLHGFDGLRLVLGTDSRFDELFSIFTEIIWNSSCKICCCT